MSGQRRPFHSLTAAAQGDEGATAIFVAVLSSLLFAVCALVVDLGAAYVREATIESSSEQAAVAAASALPDACNAVTEAALSFASDPNAVRDDSSGTPLAPTVAQLQDGDAANGEVTVLDALGAAVDPAAGCSGPGVQAVVGSPPAQVDFGLAALFGIENTAVRTVRTAERRSPLPVLPFAVPRECVDRSTRVYELEPAVPVPGGTAAVPGDAVAPPDVADASRLDFRTDPVLSPTAAPTTFQVRVRANSDSGRTWRVEFTELLSGTPRTVYSSPLPIARRFPDYRFTADDSITVPIPADVLAHPGTWRARVMRTTRAGGSDRIQLDGLWYIASHTSRDVVIPGAAPPGLPAPARVCSGTGTGDLVLIETPDPRSAIADGLDAPLVPGRSTVVLSTVDDQEDASGEVAAGLLDRMAQAPPACPVAGAPPVPAWTFLGEPVAASNPAQCYAPVVQAVDPLTGRPSWSGTDTAFALDPRTVLLPVVDVDDVSADPAWPTAPATRTVVEFAVAVISDQVTAGAVPAAPPGACPTIVDSGACAGLVAVDGDLSAVRFQISSPQLLPAGGVRLPDRGHPWVAGPADVQVIG